MRCTASLGRRGFAGRFLAVASLSWPTSEPQGAELRYRRRRPALTVEMEGLFAIHLGPSSEHLSASMVKVTSSTPSFFDVRLKKPAEKCNDWPRQFPAPAALPLLICQAKPAAEPQWGSSTPPAGSHLGAGELAWSSTA